MNKSITVGIASEEHVNQEFIDAWHRTDRDSMSRITNSMMAWKLLLFQAKLVRTQAPELFETSTGQSAVGKVLDIDGHTVKSSSSKDY